jgi:hypothetical protein
MLVSYPAYGFTSFALFYSGLSFTGAVVWHLNGAAADLFVQPLP